MIIDQKTKRKFALHVSREEMRMIAEALSTEGARWDNDKCWEACYQIRKILENSRITPEEMFAEEAELLRKQREGES